MQSWSVPMPPRLAGATTGITLFDTASGTKVDVQPIEGEATLYVCGITPYDATHMGHAATYVTFDTLHRLWIDAGLTVRYTQNITDIDDPLLERANRDGVDWQKLAESQVDLFRSDMLKLNVLAPTDYVGVTEVITPIARAVAELLDRELAYTVDTPDAEFPGARDIYFDTRATERATAWKLGEESGLDLDHMLRLSAERGGDPERPGKRDPLDPLLWRAARAGEPRWESTVGAGRPGWHIECSVIATATLGPSITVQGGGRDLVFPHHEFSAGHSTALTGVPFAHAYAHVGMVAYDGEKMSKSLGNLVLVSRLAAQGVDPRAIRLAILSNHYREDWEWTPTMLDTAQERLRAWHEAAERVTGVGEGHAIVDRVRERLADDLDTPSALTILDKWFASGEPGCESVIDAVDALLGVPLR